MGKIKVIVKTLIISTLLCTNAFASNYADTFGASPMGIALGNAMTARVNDWSSVYYNIAGLGKTIDACDIVSDGNKEFKNQLAVSYIWNKPDFNIDISRSQVDEEGTVTALSTSGDKNLETGSIILGGAIDINLFYRMPYYISSARVGLLVALNDDQTLVKINDISMQTHNFFRYGRESQSLMLMVGAGFGLFDDMMGFGLGTAQSMGGKGRILANELNLSTEEQSPYMESKFDFIIAKMPFILGGYIRPGRIYPLLEGLDLGISYRQEAYLYVDDFKMATQTAVGNIVLKLDAAMFDFYQPPITRTGFAYHTDNFTISGDLELRQWSKFKVSAIQETAYKEEAVGDEEPQIIPIPELDDVIIPRLGIQFKIDDSMDILMGYYYEKSCVPNSAVKGIFNLLDNDKHVGSVGVKYRVPKLSFLSGLRGPVDLIGSFQYQKLVKRDVTKTDQTSTANPDYSYDGDCYTIMAGFVLNL